MANVISLPIFTQLLEPAGIAPAQDFASDAASTDDLFVSGFEDDEELKDLASEAPIIRLVNHLFARALDLNASDIHFEPNEEHLDVRCRVDGIMHRIERLPVRITTAVASRLKLMARMDIGEKRYSGHLSKPDQSAARHDPDHRPHR